METAGFCAGVSRFSQQMALMLRLNSEEALKNTYIFIFSIFTRKSEKKNLKKGHCLCHGEIIRVCKTADTVINKSSDWRVLKSFTIKLREGN